MRSGCITISSKELLGRSILEEHIKLHIQPFEHGIYSNLTDIVTVVTNPPIFAFRLFSSLTLVHKSVIAPDKASLYLLPMTIKSDIGVLCFKEVKKTLFTHFKTHSFLLDNGYVVVNSST